jgi:hypothetical protein
MIAPRERMQLNRLSAVLATLLNCASTLPAVAESDQLHITIIDQAGTPSLLLVDAHVRAARVLAAAGIKSSWKLCPAASTRPGRSPCGGAGSLALSIRILSSEKAKQWPIAPSSCGIALSGAEGAHGFLAIIDSGCVAKLARPTSESRAAVLGHVMAHEIGHLLLGSGSHSPSGLMGTRWTADEMALLVRGSLHFSAEETGRLRQAMAGRAAKARDGSFATAAK